jgi:hypothetical protein
MKRATRAVFVEMGGNESLFGRQNSANVKKYVSPVSRSDISVSITGAMRSVVVKAIG